MKAGLEMDTHEKGEAFGRWAGYLRTNWCFEFRKDTFPKEHHELARWLSRWRCVPHEPGNPSSTPGSRVKVEMTS